MVRSYNVHKHNVILLKQIFQENPNIDKAFKFKNPYFQSVFMNTIAESYHSIKSNPRIFGARDIKNMDEMVKDMEFTGLELTWLKNMLTATTQMLRKRLQEEQMRVQEEQMRVQEELRHLDLVELDYD
ncbi:MATH domain and coiled-coil domain-containing protein At3g58210-like [Hibiscus syriacus]|uniref:MATH domain and coiled-coil domain-containing protein At3g58210-like n=1 Tax=Hibiscus syriacus TaxID=106335 RepID=UPI001922069E|nr:MATH domain and coiled-coil domain-containing protein At3g58210-like [Hibiscus syriacus]